MIIKTHSEAYVNTDMVAKYEVVPMFRDEPGNEFTGHITRPLDHFEVAAWIGVDKCVLGMYFNRVDAEAALEDAMESLAHHNDAHVMSKSGMVDNMQPA